VALHTDQSTFNYYTITCNCPAVRCDYWQCQNKQVSIETGSYLLQKCFYMHFKAWKVNKYFSIIRKSCFFIWISCFIKVAMELANNYLTMLHVFPMISCI
jgi:hypothetical protein